MSEKITIISSFFNEEKNVIKFYQEIKWTINFLKANDIEVVELILVDNFSSDNTYHELKKISFENVKILIFKNEKDKSNYGDGFTKGFLTAKSNHIMTIHSDLQFHLSSFLKDNIVDFKKGILENINIFPSRKGRNLFSQMRTLILKFLLLLNTKIIFQEFNGHPKLLCKKHFLSVNEYPSGFCWDAFIYYWLKKNKERINVDCEIFENKRIYGKSSWDNRNLKDNFLFLIRYIKELNKVIKLNEKKIT